MKKLFFALCLLSACLLAIPGHAAEKKHLKIVYVEWDCATASTYLAKAVLEDRFGYTVEAVPVSNAVMWGALASGDADVSVTAWLPVTHGDFLAKFKDKVDVLGTVTDGARLGLAVPDYVPLKSIEEIEANSERFQNRIIGIDPGAGIMKLTEKLLKDYKLDKMTLAEGSGATMTASLAAAIRNKEWIVVTGWSPHWMFGRWKLHYLDDPRGSLGKEENIQTVARKNLQKDHPEAWAFLSRFHYADANQLESYMNWNQENGLKTPEATARRFMQAHPELVTDWLSTQPAKQ